jgi:cell division protein FtsL
MKDAIKESSDVILRRQRENVEQMQLQARQEKLSTENKVEKLDSQIVGLRGLAVSRINNDSVLRTPSSACENITNCNVNGQIVS